MMVKPIKEVRLHNARLLQASVGGQKEICLRLDKQQAQVSSFMGDKPRKGIGDKIAREIEEAFGKPRGWLDVWHEDVLVGENTSSASTNEPSSKYETGRKAGSRIIDIQQLAECIFNIEQSLEEELEPVTNIQKANMIAGLYASRQSNGGSPVKGDVNTAIFTVLAGNAS